MKFSVFAFIFFFAAIFAVTNAFIAAHSCDPQTCKPPLRCLDGLCFPLDKAAARTGEPCLDDNQCRRGQACIQGHCGIWYPGRK